MTLRTLTTRLGITAGLAGMAIVAPALATPPPDQLDRLTTSSATTSQWTVPPDQLDRLAALRAANGIR